ncbi:YafY family transcriptional regulator [Clostridium sp. D2Q-14]|uniref:helix-turn-helix transcriptional regulator n=1 Tax=Anaeromonas gelatinilytica TaxID=2683194 RepID=UPI00193C4908|nr:YafY family protein [Anaeromonas gelatinilytica]MBS4535727.1 YafY family transcriptional regulator [Anaeromonas gelatinilytica]
MKIERLLGIVMYLINRKVVSARDLAERFKVSVRTIQRDIDSLTLAGIPVYSIQGSSGGYAIIESYKLDKQIMSIDDYFFIIKALKSLSSAYENKKVEEALEKISAIVTEEENAIIDKRNSQLSIDLSLLREPSNVDDYLFLIQKAINNQRVLELDYTNANHVKISRRIEPLSLTFKWYAWYLFSFCQLREDYRIFRISRMRNLKLIDENFTRKHKNIDKLLKECQSIDKREYINLKLLCKKEVRVSIEDYFANGKIIEEYDDFFILEISLPKNEQFWFGILLSYGDKVRVLEPPSLQKKILDKVRDIEKIYN